MADGGLGLGKKSQSYALNAISQYYSSENTFYVYLVPPKGCNISAAEFEDYLNKESSKPVKIGEKNGEDILGTYFEEGQKCRVKLFDNDKDLIIDMWEKIKKDDPSVLSGWNSDKLSDQNKSNLVNP